MAHGASFLPKNDAVAHACVALLLHSRPQHFHFRGQGCAFHAENVGRLRFVSSGAAKGLFDECLLQFLDGHLQVHSVLGHGDGRRRRFDQLQRLRGFREREVFREQDGALRAQADLSPL